VRLLVGLVTVFAALLMAALTAVSIKSAGGLDILSVISILVVVLIGVAGIGVLRSDK
jgi:hypothetical protein